MVGDHVLAVVERAERIADALFDRVAVGVVRATEHGSRMRNEHVVEVVPSIRVERPAVRNRDVNNFLNIWIGMKSIWHTAKLTHSEPGPLRGAESELDAARLGASEDLVEEKVVLEYVDTAHLVDHRAAQDQFVDRIRKASRVFGIDSVSGH